MREPSSRSRKAIHPLRDAILAAAVTFLTSAIGLSFIYLKARDAQLDAVRGELLQLAKTTAAQVDGDLHETLVNPGQEHTPEYARALAPLVRMHRASRDIVYVYTGVLRNGKAYWILDTSWNYRAPGDDGEPPDGVMTEYETFDPELMRAFKEKIAIANANPVREPDHTYLSAFAPIYDSHGKMIAILGVDMVLDALEGRLAAIRRSLLEALLLVLVLSIGAGAVAYNMRRFAASIVAKMRDARAQAEVNAAAAESATRAKTTFLAMMSHEIRTPMNGMLGVADLLRAKTADREQRRLLDVLTASGQALLRIINDILDFSKMEAERLDLRPKPFELATLLDQMELLLGSQASAKGVRFTVEADESLPPAVSGDSQRLSQVLLNLGTNAVKFTDHGEVRLFVRLLAANRGLARIEFMVRDSGIGMDSDAMSRLFTPFTQVAESRRHRGGGTGLGLVIANKLVALMGGKIAVHSEPGKGSTFSFAVELPVAEQVSETTTRAALKIESLAVLVAEDNPVNQTIITAMLRQLGHDTVMAANGREALDALARRDFDLVLMDFNMPVMDGIAATKFLRSGKAGARDPGIPVIALTANATDGDRDTCLAAGMDDFLSKPVTLAALRDTIERVRSRKAALRVLRAASH